MEYNESFIEHSLKIWGFDISNLEINKIQYIPMHEWRISTQNKPLLYIDNLQCCVGLYVYGNNFAFASHINTVVFANNEYILDENKRPIYCNRCDDLYKSILENKNIINESFKIGIAIGCSPLDNSEKSITLINDGIKDVIKKLNYLGISVIQLENIYAPEFIIDSQNGVLILTSSTKNKSK